MANKNIGLGNGLGALFGNMDADENFLDENGSLNQGVTELDIEKVMPNPNQPRKTFDELALRELAASINNVGIIQPIVVTEKNGKYLIIAGERRYRACKLANKSTIPAIIKDLSDKDCKEIALIENLQREDLNPIEEAEAMRALIEEFDLPQEELARRLGKSRPAITNSLRLLSLDERVIALIRDNRLSSGHGKALAGIKNKDVQYKYAIAACDKKMSVRQIELIVNAYICPSKTMPKAKIKLSTEIKDLINDMQRVFATKVKAVGTEEKGRIYIDYYTKDDLNRIYNIIDTYKNLNKNN